MIRAPAPKSQPDKFRDVARQIGTDKETRFEETLKRVKRAPKSAPEKKLG